MSDETNDKTYAEFQKRWRGKIVDLSPAGRDAFIRQVIEAEDGFTTVTMLNSLRFRSDCPDCALDALDELRTMNAQGSYSPTDYEAWGARARDALRVAIGDVV